MARPRMPPACAAQAHPVMLPNGQPAPEIRLIVTDVDGTLLNSKQELTPRVEAAVKAAAAAGVPLVVATGKARGPWVREVFPRIDMDMPGVFLQGLLVCDGQGGTLWQRPMEDAVVAQCLQLADSYGVTLTAYCGDRILAASLDEHTERLKFYKEPTVEAVGHLSGILGQVPVHKLIFMAPQTKIDEMRPAVEAALAGSASLTTALTGMLEVLPLGASKGSGVAWLLSHLDADASHIMALGDGENDVEMLQLSGLAVAMGNAGPVAKAAAHWVAPRNDEDGVAAAIEKFVLAPRGLSLDSSAAVVASTAHGGAAVSGH
eukprot:CAMPEP_0202870918 /NCGR_PEP_ID=MMETSP1391-20130828/17200_1 /ASSEMBLY_ACC=CAM_ASM_000867 /TAXON_ID=1034604 /ORGANISM="Chlamydomonas leiostraca, Strain SAG 11-49" /LENGTH=317 /DNA_ID=CAMNT_0049551593 /DNA_START=119 /DNA_END=1072 /DNA_ORIENTATION=-